MCQKHLDVKSTQLEFFNLVPVTDESEFIDENGEISSFVEIAVRIKESGKEVILDLSLKSVEEIIKTKEKYQTELDKTNEALRTYLVELKQMRHMFAETDEEKNGSDGVKENYMKKAL